MIWSDIVIVKFKNNITREFIQTCISELTFPKFWLSDESDISDTYAILINDTLVGFIEFQIENYKNGRRYANIAMFEILNKYRGRGFGRLIVSELFKQFRLVTLYGESANIAIQFWYRLGANFDMSDEKLCKYLNQGYSASFKLTKNSFKQCNVMLM